MQKSLFVNGCSHTAGAEIEHPGQGICYDKAWGKHLADKLDYEYFNYATSGASNARIVRTTYDFIFRYAKKKRDFKNLFIVIMWPGFYRTEIHFEKKYDYNWDDNWLPIVVGNDKRYYDTLPAPLYNYYQGWVTYTDNTMAATEFYGHLLNLQNLFKRYGVKHMFLNATPTCADLAKSKEFDIYSIHVDRNRFPDFRLAEKSYTAMCHQSGKSISQYSVESGFNSHYDEEAHKWYAQHLFEIVKDRDLL